MKLWYLERTDGVGWDDYDSFVIRAATKAGAIDISLTHGWGASNAGYDDIDCTELLQDGEPDIIIGSFNAG